MSAYYYQFDKTDLIEWQIPQIHEWILRWAVI